MKPINIILPSLLLAMSVSAYAEEQVAKVSGFYIGAGYGSFDYTAESDVENSLYYSRFAETIDGGTLKVYGGYQFNRVIGVEATYTNYGRSEGYIDGQQVTQSPTAVSVAANAGYTFKNGLRPFALMGLSYMTLNLESNTPVFEANNSGAIRYGLGVDYTPALLNGLQLRLAYEGDMYFEKSDLHWNFEATTFNLSSFYAGVSYKF